jgi:ATP-dependent exoDNAse (exonuclease V) alpha subunit
MENDQRNYFLSDQQRLVIEAFEQGKNIFVTGSAGTGKSHLLNFFRKNYSLTDLAITASTGIAAVNIGGSTVHSWSGIGLGNLPIEQILHNISTKKFTQIRRRIQMAKALAIDEISMISAKTLETLDQVFQSVRGNKKPMGGLQIMMFGDFLQLSPINDSEFCFESKTWQNLDLKIFVLSEIFRQNNQDFINILNDLRFGVINQRTREILTERMKIKDQDFAIKPTILTTHNFKVETINEQELKKIFGEERVYQAQYFGDSNKIEFLKKNCLAKENLKLKIGAQVMMIKNTYQKEGVINGSLGIIKGFSTRKFYPIVEFSNGAKITICPEEWLIEKLNLDTKNIEVEASLVQIPLILSWAITIHKSQGLTLDKISCDLENVFGAGQVYVALSRARSLKGIFIQSLNFEKIISNQKAIKFYQNLNEIY